jgi:DNA-binding transcriptional MerR regulator
MKIGVLAKQVGVSASAIRFYESEGLLPRIVRSGGKRSFSEGDVLLLRLIQEARNAGFAIREIKDILSTGGDRSRGKSAWRFAVRRKIADIRQQVDRLEKIREILESAIQCDCLELESCEKLLKPPTPTTRHAAFKTI